MSNLLPVSRKDDAASLEGQAEDWALLHQHRLFAVGQVPESWSPQDVLLGEGQPVVHRTGELGQHEHGRQVASGEMLFPSAVGVIGVIYIFKAMLQMLRIKLWLKVPKRSPKYGFARSYRTLVRTIA